MHPVLVFDIETVPDCAGLIRLHGLDPATPHAHVAEIAFQTRRRLTGNDFLPHHVQQVVAISCVLRDRDHFRVWSLGSLEDTEAALVQRFFDGIEKYTPQLVSWNGNGFDLPVLHYRSLVHGLSAPRYWETGEEDREFRYNNYLSRYHARHLDLMDLLALYQGRANAPLDDLARLCGFPGKLGMDGSQVWQAYQAGELAKIRAYCETDVVNTYLVYLRFQRLRGHLTAEQYRDETTLVRTALAAESGTHWREYLDAWGPAD